LETNAALCAFTAQISRETINSSEFYLFPDYTALDGTLDLDASDGVADMSVPLDDGNGTTLAGGDCVVLVQRTTTLRGSLVRRFRIYFRACRTSDTSLAAPLRYYESHDWGPNGTPESIESLLNAVNLKDNTSYSLDPASQTVVSSSSYALVGHSNRLIAARAKGTKDRSGTRRYPIFCSESPMLSATNENFSINVEFIAGGRTDNILSSSSFNYTVSPRR
jgi:hypothetical protein